MHELLAHAAAGDLAPARRADRAGAADAPRRPGPRAGDGIRRQLAGFPPLRGTQRVDRERFPSFTNELRQAMYEEPIRFFVDLASRNRSVLDLLDADYTFVNPILAKHYGMTDARRQSPDEWARVDERGASAAGGCCRCRFS